MMNKLINTYDLAARVAPVTLALSPVIIGILVLLHVSEVQGVTFASVVVTLLFLMSFVVREMGKAREFGIFTNPQPIADFLKYKGKHASNEDDYPIDQDIKRVVHRKIENIINKYEKKFNLPENCKTEQALCKNKKEANYEIAGNCLIDIMRDREKWPIIYDKNVRFAFIRNLYSIKLICLISNIITLSLACVYFIDTFYYNFLTSIFNLSGKFDAISHACYTENHELFSCSPCADYLISLLNFCSEANTKSNIFYMGTHKLFSIIFLFIVYIIFSILIITLLSKITKERFTGAAYEYAKYLMISMYYYDEIKVNSDAQQLICVGKPTDNQERTDAKKSTKKPPKE